MNKGYLLGAGVVVAVLVFIGALLANNTKNQTEVIKTKAPATDSNTTDAREITVSAFEMGYNLSSINLKRGEKVRINLTNTGKFPHDFILEELPQIKTKVIKPGEKDSVEFIVPMTGDLTYYCSIGTHRDQGMEGKFVITE